MYTSYYSALKLCLSIKSSYTIKSSADKNSTRVNLSGFAYYILAYFISESGELNQIVLWLM